MGDGWSVALALATAAGALVARPVPLWAGLTLAVIALAARRPAVLCAAALLVASTMGARAWAGLEHPPRGRLDALVTLVSDPQPVDASLRVDLRFAHKRVEAWARGPAAASLRDRAAGERVHLTGRLGPVPPKARMRLAVRHVAARLSVDHVGGHREGNAPSRVANALRRTLVRGAAS
ncbi:MAG: competence protein ComEC, partial [Actinomycetota bacterium]|nr:competence protein ComEC [Actinomycetota bacterium]